MLLLREGSDLVVLSSFNSLYMNQGDVLYLSLPVGI